MKSIFDKPTGSLRWIRRRAQLSYGEVIELGYHAINWAAAYGTGATTWLGPAGFNFSQYQALIPGRVGDWDPEVAKSMAAPQHYMDAFSLSDTVSPVELLSEELLPAVAGTKGEIVRWLQAELSVVKLRRDRFDRLYLDPDRLVLMGYRLARIAARQYSIGSHQVAAALCMTGLGAVCFWARDRCDLCFRLPVPGLARCGLHCQSKLNLGDEQGDPSRRAHSSRIARKMVTAYADLQQALRMGSLLPTFEHAIAGILWPDCAAKAFYQAELIQGALAAAPLVHELLPDKFLSLPAPAQMEVLRVTLDPNEWVSYLWPDKIGNAQRWLAAERNVAPGRQTGLTQLNIERVAAASRLLAQGVAPSEIAQRLDISRSHLSHLMQRSRKAKTG